MVFQSMAPRVVVAALLIACCAPGSLRAQDVAADPTQPTRARWPEPIKNRNARYANLARVDDVAGDAHERVIAKALTDRVDDPLGDREERRRHLCAKHVPPRATEFARVERDRGDDAEQIVIAETRNRPGQKRASRLAEVRRFRDLAGDGEELAIYKMDRLRGPMVNDPDAVEHVQGKPRDDRFFNSREDTIHVDGAETQRDLERVRDAEDERDTERQLGREEAGAERDTERNVEAQSERDAERDAEKADEKDADAAERDSERETERADESKTDRDAERQLEQEEQNGAGAGK